MTVKDLQIDSPVYNVGLDSIMIARVRLIEAFSDGTRKIELNYKGHGCVEKLASIVSEITTETKYAMPLRWYLDLDDAQIAQTMLRAEHVSKLKRLMEDAQNAYAEAINKYAFAEPSTPQEK